MIILAHFLHENNYTLCKLPHALLIYIIHYKILSNETNDRVVMVLHVIVYHILGRGNGFNNTFEDYCYYDLMGE